MSTQNICDVCNKQGAMYKASLVYKWYELGWHKRTTDICFDCWHEFEGFIAKKQKKVSALTNVVGSTGGGGGMASVKEKPARYGAKPKKRSE